MPEEELEESVGTPPEPNESYAEGEFSEDVATCLHEATVTGEEGEPYCLDCGATF